MTRTERIESAIAKYEKEIKAREKQLKKYEKEQLVELARSNNVPYEGKRISWLRYDLAVKLETGYVVG